MKIKNIFRRFIDAVKISKAIVKAEDLQSKGKFEEALQLLINIKDIAYEKHYSYHLNLGRLYVDVKNDFLLAIQEFDIGLKLINKEKRNNNDEKEYLLCWSKYMKGWCMYSIGEKVSSENFRNESGNHFFNISNVRRGLKQSFPMEWHVDYKY